MKKLLMVIPLVFLLCFTFSCQQGEEVVRGGLTEEEVNVILGEVVKVYNNADMEACDKVYSADYVETDPLEPGWVGAGIDAFKEAIRTLHKEYSGINLSFDEAFIKGDKVAVLFTWKVTHTSGAEAEVSGVNVARIADGKIVEATYYYDTIEVLEEMGYKIIPPEVPEKKEEPEKAVSGKTASETTESVKTHLGGCILLSPTGKVPDDLYQESGVVPTDEYKPFTKKLSVYGIVLIGRDDISDDFMRKVAKTIKEMFPQGEGIDAELQKEVLRNMYKYKTVIPFFKGQDQKLTPEEEAVAYITWQQNSMCDIIMEGVPGQVNEVVEHILHFVTDIGLHYTFPDEWGISKTSKVYQAMQEAIDKEYYIVDQYGQRDSEAGNRVLIQEFAYWLICSAWNLLEPYGPDAEWKIIRTTSDLKEKLSLSYELFESTIPKVMRSPSIDTLEEFKEFEGSEN